MIPGDPLDPAGLHPPTVAGTVLRAALLAFGFALLEMIAGTALGDEFRPDRGTLGLSGIAFWGGLLAGLWHRRNSREAPP